MEGYSYKGEKVLYLISACLCGLNCRYDGTNNFDERVKSLYDRGNCIALCPEHLGNLSIPREPHEIVNGEGKDVLAGKANVISKIGIDNTAKFIDGAYKTLQIAKLLNIDTAILKSKSPSCGSGQIYNGSFKKELISGNGVTAELLSQNGIKILTEKDIKDLP